MCHLCQARRHPVNVWQLPNVPLQPDHASKIMIFNWLLCSSQKEHGRVQHPSKSCAERSRRGQASR